jgi:hypothetical protein
MVYSNTKRILFSGPWNVRKSIYFNHPGGRLTFEPLAGIGEKMVYNQQEKWEEK